MCDLILHIDRSGTVLGFTGPRQNDLFLSSDDITGKSINDIVPPDLSESFSHFVEKALRGDDQKIFSYQLLISTKNSRYEAKFVTGGDDRVLIIVRDISDHKSTERRIEYLSYHDTLTNLPNRYLLKDRLERAIANAARKNRLLAVVLLDLDNFKNVNDTIGHSAGDRLLQGFADRLSKCVRQTDSVSRAPADEEDSFIARLGGDEFTILLSEIENIQDPAKVSNRILEMLSEPFTLGPHEVFVSVSIGIAVYPFDGKDIDSLIKNADVAMYQAKNRGRNNYQYYSESLNVFSLERLMIENKLRKALYHNEFMLFYQPQIDISTGELIGVEALIRWLQPDLILIKPGEFIPIAEESGIIVPIGEWVLRTACSQNVSWQKAGLTPMRMTVNVSSIQFAQENFVEMVFGILRETGLKPGYLQLELTEGTIMKHSEEAVKKLRSLKEMGIRISLDDFGTGYSSLNYLKRFPLTTLKIDKSFIKDIATNSDDQSITKTIIDIANNFHLVVIAEGVETKEQLSLLQTYGCNGIQGHLICPPVNPISLAQFAKAYKGRSILHIRH
ncbi:MAG TPA: EAL domain-containing protein [Thermodesulfovibrionales bacterium]|nr:EAL domain-containing protein [Thermodesulfovibrionales bacterium]